ncbi:MAG: hypothetical protein Ct9H300mP1_10160 [Planctomycetaceae bacterium]|nr:MAG: hypothetical protein Ct9H300mP1_10160 [Planctomycetaceae bacterium]
MWPGLQAVASKYQDKPVLFLAVNSGTPRFEVQSYLKKNRVPGRPSPTWTGRSNAAAVCRRSP